MMIEKITWVNPSDDIPDDDILVLAIVAGECRPAYRMAGLWFEFGSVTGRSINAPTFWADFPEGPK